ncbi:hypothetical protein Acsp04_44910 [Actinomadura sp. NBRC 104425]|nr:hypothetical protein Acsp04_44910 [Actinomadura sp. NBRC 104425]
MRSVEGIRPRHRASGCTAGAGLSAFCAGGAGGAGSQGRKASTRTIAQRKQSSSAHDSMDASLRLLNPHSLIL